MGRRSSWRIPIRLDIKFRSGGVSYSGIVRNLSEYGMFISIENSRLPLDSAIEVFILHKEGTLNLPARLVRFENNEGLYKGIGIELIDPPATYLNFVENLLYTL